MTAEGSLLAAFANAYATLRAFEVVLIERTLAACIALVNLIRMLAYDPWEPEEAIFVVVWFAAVVPVCRALHRAAWALRKLPEPPFEQSALGVASTPLKAMTLPFCILWFFDNSINLMQAAGVEINRAASPLLSGTPSAVYILWAGYALLHVQNAWFASASRTRGEAALAVLGVRPTLQRVLALCTIATTLACASAAIGADPKALLGVGGLLGFASSLAVKDVLGNLFAGISLAIQRPFSEGDEITFGATNVFRCTARVVKLGYINTVLRDADSQLIYVPNSQLTSMSITNSGRRSHMRVTGEFVLRVSDAPKLPQLLASLSSELAQLPQVDVAATPVAVNVAGFTPAGVTLSVSALFGRGTKSKEELRSAAWLAVARVVEREGCAFAGKG